MHMVKRKKFSLILDVQRFCYSIEGFECLLISRPSPAFPILL